MPHSAKDTTIGPELLGGNAIELYFGPAAIAVTALLGSGIGSFLGAYLKRKGENLATHEDVDKLVKQVAAVTQTTKEIEAKISNEVWDRQRQWEMKKEVLFAAAKQISAMEDALLDLNTAFRTAAASPSDSTEHNERKLEVARAWNKASVGFDESVSLSSLVCEPDVTTALHMARTTFRVVAGEIFRGDPDGL